MKSVFLSKGIVQCGFHLRREYKNLRGLTIVTQMGFGEMLTYMRKYNGKVFILMLKLPTEHLSARLLDTLLLLITILYLMIICTPSLPLLTHLFSSFNKTAFHRTCRKSSFVLQQQNLSSVQE